MIREGNGEKTQEEKRTHKRRSVDPELGHRERSERNTSVQAAKKNRPSEVEARTQEAKPRGAG